MAQGVFTITELMPDGSEVRQFAWSADRVAPEGSLGGARACPLKAWELAGKQRTSRTDYPGGKVPTEQVLGPAREPFTLRGRFDDRYNFAGYAVDEMRRCEAMCMRGNQVRMQYQAQSFIGIITSWKFDYEIEWLIRYEIEMSVHRRPDESFIQFQSDILEASRILEPITAGVNLAEAYVVALEEVDTGRPALLDGDIGDTVTEALATVSEQLESLEATLDAREVTVVLDNTVTPFRRLATQMRSLRGAALTLSDSLVAARADLDVSVRDAISVLNFETWSRGLRENCRRLAGGTFRSAQQIEERDAPMAETVYRPRAGESLYRIARQFYGTADAWRLIAERNALSTVQLTGEEVLIIPKRGQG